MAKADKAFVRPRASGGCVGAPEVPISAMILRRHVLAAIAAAGLLAACAAEPPRRPPPAGIMAVSARLAAPPAQAVEVEVGNIPPGRRVERVVLIDAEGTRHPAPTLVTLRTSEGGLTSGPRVGIGVSGGSSSGINPSISLGWNVTGDQTARSGQRIEARIPIPDPAAYRATAPRWRVEVGFTELDGEPRTLTFPVGAE